MDDAQRMAAAEAAARETHVVTTALPPEAVVKILLKTWDGWIGASTLRGASRRSIVSGDSPHVSEVAIAGDTSRANLMFQLEPPDPDRPGITRVSMAVADYQLSKKVGVPLYGALVVALAKLRKAEQRLDPVQVEIRTSE